MTLEPRDGHATVIVEDEGDGIPPELLPHVFDLFVQGDHTLARSQGGLGVPIVAVTGYGQDQDRARSREAGFDEHLAKPVDPAAVHRLVLKAPSGG